MPLHVSSTCAHRQEIKIILYSLWYHHTYRWPSRAQVERGNIKILNIIKSITVFPYEASTSYVLLNLSTMKVRPQSHCGGEKSLLPFAHNLTTILRLSSRYSVHCIEYSVPFRDK